MRNGIQNRRWTLAVAAGLIGLIAAGDGLAQGRPDWREAWRRQREQQAEQAKQATATSASAQLNLDQIEKILGPAEHAAFDLRIRTPMTGVWAMSRGILLSEAGFAVTPFHPLKGATGAFLEVPDSTRALPVELWDVEPQINIALLKMDLRGVPEGAKLAPIDLASQSDLNMTMAWTLGVDPFGRPTVSAGHITGVIPHTALPAEVRKAMRYDNLSYWVQTSALVDVNNSGGLLVDGNGKLAGISTWYWSGQQQQNARDPRSRRRRDLQGQGAGTHYALYVEHLRDLLDHRSEDALGFDGARMQFYNARLPGHSLPRIKVESPQHARQLRRAVNSFAQSAVCPLCFGEGQLELDEANPDPQEQTTGTNSRNTVPAPPNSNSDDEEKRYKECPRCEGTGLNKPDALFKAGANVGLCLAALDRSDPKSQYEIVHLQRTLDGIVERNPQRLVEPINSEARLHLHPTAMVVGTPILVLGVAEQMSGQVGDFGQLARVTLGDKGPTILLAEPDLADPNTPDIVMAAGILAGYIDDENGMPMPVLHGGFLVNVPADEDGETSGLSSRADQEARTREQQIQQRIDRWRDWMRQRSRDFGRGRR